MEELLQEGRPWKSSGLFLIWLCEFQLAFAQQCAGCFAGIPRI